jgi:hypothetical protein
MTYLLLLSLVLDKLLLLLQNFESLLVGSSLGSVQLGFVDLSINNISLVCLGSLTRFSGKLLKVVINESMTLSPFCSKLKARLRINKTPETPLV